MWQWVNGVPTFNGSINIGGDFQASGSVTATANLVASGVVWAANTTATPAGGAVGVRVLIGSAAVSIFTGTGVPTVSAAKGSLYSRTDATTTTSRLYINTDGGTTWTTFTTAA